MNNNSIKTYDDLLQEEKRLTAHLAILKQTLKDDIGGVKEGVKDKLNPLKKIKEKARTFFTRADKNSPTINFIINFVLDFIIRKFIPNRTSLWTKTVIPFLTKNWASHLITEEHRTAIAKFMNDTAGKVDQYLQKAKAKKEETQNKEAAAAATEGTLAS